LGYSASGKERIAELYYRIALNDQLEITPDLQLIQRAGGNANAHSARVVGVRASMGF
jgi:carbohydrate-selective porin OprB